MIFSREELELSRRVFAEEAALAKRMCRIRIFGAGRLGGWTRSRFAQAGIETEIFVDNNPSLWGTEVGGVPVMSLDQFAKTADQTPLVMCIGGSDGAAVRRQCGELGIQTIPLYKAMAVLRVGCFAEPMRAEDIEGDPQARAALDIWADNESRNKYLRFIKFHALRDAAFFMPREETQYFNPNYMPRRHLRAVADVGAYDGDTLEKFLDLTGGDFDSYHACEPDTEFFERLAEKIRLLAPETRTKIRLHNMAAGDVTGETRMQKCAASATMIAADGDMVVRMDTLDAMLADVPVSLIKMDIEGAEPAALRGAARVIAAHRPALAISVYHRVDHLWAIPLWIRELNLGYALRLGCHSDTYNEIICYAIPEGH